MRGGIINLALAVAALTGSTVSALDPVTVKGNAFFVGDERVCFSVHRSELYWNVLLIIGTAVLHPWCRLPARWSEQPHGPSCKPRELQA
jgi:hypothetical protein